MVDAGSMAGLNAERSIFMGDYLAVHAIASKSILVVEDEPSVADAFHLLLSIDKHQVETVADGETALARYNEGGYDLVITDFLMPGIDGLELARLIKERAPHTPVVLITAYSENLLHDEQPRLKYVDAVLGKPFPIEQLYDVLRAVFPRG